MSFVGGATGVFGLLGKAWNLLRDRQDSVRAQAKRLIETFEAYGIAGQQIGVALYGRPPESKYWQHEVSTEVAALYPACWCRRLVLLALMAFAGGVPISESD